MIKEVKHNHQSIHYLKNLRHNRNALKVVSNLTRFQTQETCTAVKLDHVIEIIIKEQE